MEAAEVAVVLAAVQVAVQVAVAAKGVAAEPMEDRKAAVEAAEAVKVQALRVAGQAQQEIHLVVAEATHPLQSDTR